MSFRDTGGIKIQRYWGHRDTEIYGAIEIQRCRGSQRFRDTGGHRDTEIHGAIEIHRYRGP